MAAAELTGEHALRAPSPRIALLGWLGWYVTVWASTLATAGLVVITGEQASARRVLALRLSPASNAPPGAAHVLALAAHNLPITCWPLLLGLTGVQRHRVSRKATDMLVLSCLLVNTLPVGAALAGYGLALIAYVPQLPVEWAALALGYASWPRQRARPMSARERVTWAALLSGLVMLAALLECAGAPHR
jgi:hypothetical protein